jgi:hypothetical protein
MDGVRAQLLAERAWVLQATFATGTATLGLNLVTAAALLPFGARICSSLWSDGAALGG